MDGGSLSSQLYSQLLFFKKVRAAWDLAHDCKFRPLEDNLYTMQFFVLGMGACDAGRALEFPGKHCHPYTL